MLQQQYFQRSHQSDFWINPISSSSNYVGAFHKHYCNLLGQGNWMRGSTTIQEYQIKRNNCEFSNQGYKLFTENLFQICSKSVEFAKFLFSKTQNLSISNFQGSKIFVRDRESSRQRKDDIIGIKDIAHTFFSNFPKIIIFRQTNS